MFPIQLVAEVEELRQEGIEIDLFEADGLANIILRSWPIPSAMNKSSSDVLLRIPMGYPGAKIDMFWTDVDLRLRNGSIPRSADSIETVANRQWRRFSWHPNSWNPGIDNLRTYLEFVLVRLSRAE
jgi:hypothetical protein